MVLHRAVWDGSVRVYTTRYFEPERTISNQSDSVNGLKLSLASQTFARKTGRSGDISTFVTLPESGKDQSDHSTDYRVHSKRR